MLLLLIFNISTFTDYGPGLAARSILFKYFRSDRDRVCVLTRVNFDAVLGIPKRLSECLYSYICLIVDHAVERNSH